MIFATGCDLEMTRGINLVVRVGDGGIFNSGTDVGAPSATAATTPNVPGISDIDLLTGTIWAAGDQTASFVGEFLPGPARIDNVIGFRNADVPSTVALNGKIGTLNVDTTGVNPGSYMLFFEYGTAAGESTTFLDNASCGVLGAQTLRVTAVPEPSAFLLVGLLGVFGCIGKWCNLRATKSA